MVDANAAAAGDAGDPSAAELQSGEPEEETTIAEGAEAAAQLAAGGKENDEARASESDADERDKTASVAILDDDKVFSTVVLSKTEAPAHRRREHGEGPRVDPLGQGAAALEAHKPRRTQEHLQPGHPRRSIRCER